MSVMKAEPCPILGRLLLATATAAVLAVAGCGTTDRLSPSNLRVEIRPDKSVFAPGDSFKGTFKFINRSMKSIRAEFPTSRLYSIVFYDNQGTRRFSYDPVAYQVLTYLELGPLGTRTDKLKFPFYSYAIPEGSVPPGTYRVRAWVEYHEDIYSEATIEVR
jgi:hypothetical protein